MTGSPGARQETVQEIIGIALRALFSIDELAGKIALHGGQAMIAHGISHRASQDIDLFVEESSFTERQAGLIREAFDEEFRDSGFEVRRFITKDHPVNGTPKVQKEIIATIAEKASPNSPLVKFNGHRGLFVQISLNNSMFQVTEINSGNVHIAVATLTRLVYEKTFSLCQNSPGYRKRHPGKGNLDGSPRAKDMFDISSILQAKPGLEDRLTSPENIDQAKTLMKENGIEKGDLAVLREDLSTERDLYERDYSHVNDDLVPAGERIGFEKAERMMMQLLTRLSGKL